MARALLTVESIHRAIPLLRGRGVMLDHDLARLYGVTTGRRNEAMKRNRARFPADFAFRLRAAEADDLKSQTAISSRHGGRRSLPMAFTEQGVAMLSGILNSRRAVAVNIEIMRAFVQMGTPRAAWPPWGGKAPSPPVSPDTKRPKRSGP